MLFTVPSFSIIFLSYPWLLSFFYSADVQATQHVPFATMTVELLADRHRLEGILYHLVIIWSAYEISLSLSLFCAHSLDLFPCGMAITRSDILARL